MVYIYEAICVLGDALNSDRSMTSLLKERVKKATKLYHAGSSNKLIMSGGDPHKRGITEAEQMREYARAFDVFDADISLEERSLDTAGNAYFTKTGILIPNLWMVICMLTSAPKIARAELIFRHVLGPDYNLSVHPVAHDFSEEELKELEGTERALTKTTYEHFFDGATPGNDEENLRRILERSQIYFDRPEYNPLRAEVGVPFV